MCERSGRRPLVGRAVAASTIATFAALVSHVAAGGAAPPALALVAITVLSWLPAIALVGPRTSRAGLTLVVLASECAFHAVFTWLAVGGSAAVPMPGMPGMGGPVAVAAAQASMPQTPAMWVAHGCAALLTLALCLHGDAALRTLRRAVGRVVLARMPHLVTVPSPSVLVPHAQTACRPRSPAVRLHPRRGPPLATSH